MNVKKLTTALVLALGLSGTAWADECITPDVVGYDSVGCLSEGLASVYKNGKVGFVDETGELVIAPSFGWAWDFSEGLAVVGYGNEVGYIDKTGKIAIPLYFDDADSFVDGKAWVEKNGEGFYIDKQGKRLN